MKTLCTLFGLVICGLAVASGIVLNVVVNGKTLGISPITRNGTTFVPLRAVSEGLGAEVDYSYGIVTVKKDLNEATLRLGSTYASANGRDLRLTAAPFMSGRTVYVPLRFVGEALGANVNHRAALGVIEIELAQSPPTPVVELPSAPITPIVAAPALLQTPKAAIVPWILTDCTDGGRESAMDSLRRAVTARGFEIIEDAKVRQVCITVLGDSQPDWKNKALPTPKQMLEIGQILGAQIVVSGRLDWDTKSIFVFPQGMVTKAYTECDALIVDTQTQKLILDQRGIKADSQNRSDASMYASWLLLGLPNPFSGGPKDPPHRLAGAIVVAKALAPWVNTTGSRIK